MAVRSTQDGEVNRYATVAPPLDLEPIKARDAALREDGEAWDCKDCDWCPDCHRLSWRCEKHNDDQDVPALVAEVERLRQENAALTQALYGP